MALVIFLAVSRVYTTDSDKFRLFSLSLSKAMQSKLGGLDWGETGCAELVGPGATCLVGISPGDVRENHGLSQNGPITIAKTFFSMIFSNDWRIRAVGENMYTRLNAPSWESLSCARGC